MTASTAQGRTSPLVWVAIVVLAALVLLVAFGAQDDAVVGGVGDPEGTGREGMRALALLIEEAGGTTQSTSAPNEGHDVAVLALPVYVDVFADFRDDGVDRTEELHEPIFDWVEAGGVLITGVDVPDGPEPAFDFVEDDTEVERGSCTIDELAGTSTLRVLPHAPLEVEPGDAFCFGDEDESVVVERTLGAGRIVQLATPSIMYNQSLDDADNAAVLARLMNLGPDRSVAFLTGPELGGAFGNDGPVNDDGQPVGAGESTITDLIPSTVFALLVGLGGAFLLFAIGRGRRLGSPVEETLPIELPSSSYTEAVGRMYGRAEQPRARSAQLLRDEFRTSMSRRVGLAADASTAEVAAALSLPTGRPAAEIERLLDGPPPEDDDALVALATSLADAKTAMTTNRTAPASRAEERTLA